MKLMQNVKSLRETSCSSDTACYLRHRGAGPGPLRKGLLSLSYQKERTI